jgi:hypothetical protein
MPLLGREPELKELVELVDAPAGRSGALIRGEVGIGESALVRELVSAASVSGVQVLTTTGAEAERNLPYAGLHQLLHPLRSGIDALPAPQRDALLPAMGMAAAPEPGATPRPNQPRPPPTAT